MWRLIIKSKFRLSYTFLRSTLISHLGLPIFIFMIISEDFLGQEDILESILEALGFLGMRVSVALVVVQVCFKQKKEKKPDLFSSVLISSPLCFLPCVNNIEELTFSRK